MTAGFRVDGPTDAGAAIILAHGAGAGMNSPFMDWIAHGLATAGTCVIRFEFPYMRRRRLDGKRRPPDRMPVLLDSFREIILDIRQKLLPQVLVIGGKSMGGRVASMLADELGVDGVLCLGYPFHPAGRPESLRTAHLEGLRTPTLIIQGTRDPLGSQDEVHRLGLSSAVEIFWAEDGDHDLKPRRASGRSSEENLSAALARIKEFLRELETTSSSR